MTASSGAGSTTWTLDVKPVGRLYLYGPVDGSCETVQLQSTCNSTNAENPYFPSDSSLGVYADSGGLPLEDVPVTFDVSGTGGSFPGGKTTATVTSEFHGWAFSPLFTAGTRAGRLYISVTAPGFVGTLPLGVTVTSGSPHAFVPTSGNLQSTQIDTPFPNPLKGHYVDQYGNVVTDVPPAYRQFYVENGCTPDGKPCATWPNGSTGTGNVMPAADGTFTLPALPRRPAGLGRAEHQLKLLVRLSRAVRSTLQPQWLDPQHHTWASGHGHRRGR